MSIIQAKEVKKWFGDFQALKGISMEVAEGEVLVICGPSGSGKSTFIRCINRLEQHQEGEIIVDDGALKAINNGKSLLPAGVKKINGIFEKGDHVLIKGQNNIEYGRGLTSFSSKEIEKIRGSHSSEIKNILGYSSREEIIHKDDLVKI